MGYFTKLIIQAKPALVEAFGTFLLVLVGTSALVAINITGQATSVSVLLLNTLAFAGTLGWLVFAFGKYSGGHFNPAVSVYWWLRGRLSSSWLASYMVAQTAGAIMASILVALLYGPVAITVGLGAAYPATAMGPWAAVIAECLGTSFLLVAVTKTVQWPPLSPIRQGGYVAAGLGLGILAATGVSGAALNPARALAPQLVAANAASWWVYIVGPMAAAVLVGGGLMLWQKIQTRPETNLLSTDPIVTMATQPIAVPKNEDIPQFNQEQAELQAKAQAAVETLRHQTQALPQSEASPIDSESNSSSPSAAPVMPSFQTLSPTETEEVKEAVVEPQPSTTTQPHSVTPVRFVEFDQPTNTSSTEE